MEEQREQRQWGYYCSASPGYGVYLPPPVAFDLLCRLFFRWTRSILAKISGNVD